MEPSPGVSMRDRETTVLRTEPGDPAERTERFHDESMDWEAGKPGLCALLLTACMRSISISYLISYLSWLLAQQSPPFLGLLSAIVTQIFPYKDTECFLEDKGTVRV